MTGFLQSAQWAAFKEKYGWQTERLGEILVLSRPILLGQTILYAPEANLAEREAIQSLVEQVKPLAKEQQAFVFRLEIALPVSSGIEEMLRELGFKKAFESVQPEWRAVVDVRPNEKEILATMHPKGRYNIRVAQKHGLTFTTGNVNEFYTLYKATAKREGFSPRGQGYFQDFLTMVPGATLFLVSKDKTPLAAAITVFDGETASYLYGASSSQDRQFMAPYLLHWEIIKEAKRRGCREYDLGEVPPADQPDHPLQGLGEFKMKFGSKIVHLVGSWDYIFQPLWYNVFRVGEKLRRGFRAA